MSLVSVDIRFMRIFAEVPREWDVKRQRVVENSKAIVSVFAGYFFENFRDKASIII